MALFKHMEHIERTGSLSTSLARFTTMRCDFGSEMARQGHGGDLIVAALITFCASRPGFRVIPVAPRFQDHNKAESAWGPISGGIYANARVGDSG